MGTRPNESMFGRHEYSDYISRYSYRFFCFNLHSILIVVPWREFPSARRRHISRKLAITSEKLPALRIASKVPLLAPSMDNCNMSGKFVASFSSLSWQTNAPLVGMELLIPFRRRVGR